MQVGIRPLIVKHVKPCASQRKSPTEELRHQLHRPLVRLQRFLQAIKFSKFLCQPPVNKRIFLINPCNVVQFCNRLLFLPPPDQQPPFRPADIQRIGLHSEHSVIGLNGLLRVANGRQDVTTYFVEGDRFRMNTQTVIENLQRRRDCPTVPCSFGMFSCLFSRQPWPTISRGTGTRHQRQRERNHHKNYAGTGS